MCSSLCPLQMFAAFLTRTNSLCSDPWSINCAHSVLCWHLETFDVVWYITNFQHALLACTFLWWWPSNDWFLMSPDQSAWDPPPLSSHLWDRSLGAPTGPAGSPRAAWLSCDPRCPQVPLLQLCLLLFQWKHCLLFLTSWLLPLLSTRARISSERTGDMYSLYG